MTTYKKQLNRITARNYINDVDFENLFGEFLDYYGYCYGWDVYRFIDRDVIERLKENTRYLYKEYLINNILKSSKQEYFTQHADIIDILVDTGKLISTMEEGIESHRHKSWWCLK